MSLLQWPLVIIKMTVTFINSQLILDHKLRHSHCWNDHWSFQHWLGLSSTNTRPWHYYNDLNIPQLLTQIISQTQTRSLLERPLVIPTITEFCSTNSRPCHYYNDHWLLLKWPQHSSTLNSDYIINSDTIIVGRTTGHSNNDLVYVVQIPDHVIITMTIGHC